MSGFEEAFNEIERAIAEVSGGWVSADEFWAEASKRIPTIAAQMVATHASGVALSMQGETDAPGAPRPADCRCSTFHRCEPCRVAEAIAEGRRFAIRWTQPDGQTGLGDAFATYAECAASIERGNHIDRVNARFGGVTSLMRYSVAELGVAGVDPGCITALGGMVASSVAKVESWFRPVDLKAEAEANGYKESDILRLGEPAKPVDPMVVKYDGLSLRVLLARDELRRQETFTDTEYGTDPALTTPFTPAQRDAISAHWSAELRAKVAASKAAERNAVLVDLQDDD